MRWLSRLLPILLLIVLLVPTTAVLADDSGLDVGIVIVGDEPDVDIAVIGDNPNVTVGIAGDNPTVNVNGQDISQPTVIVKQTIHQSGDSSWTDFKRYIKQVMEPVNIFMGEAVYRIDLTSVGLAKLIAVVQGSNSSHTAMIEENRIALEENQSKLKRLEEVVKQGELLQAYELKAVRVDMQRQINSVEYQVRCMEWEYKTWLTYLGWFCLLSVFGLALALGLLSRKVRRM